MRVPPRLVALALRSFSSPAAAPGRPVSPAWRAGRRSRANAAIAPERLLDDVQHRTFNFFWETANPKNGLVPDRWPTHSFSSIAAVGFGLTAYGIGAERGWVTREAAAQRVLTTLRFFRDAKQSPMPRARPAIAASTTTSWTWIRASGSRTSRCRRSTRRSSLGRRALLRVVFRSRQLDRAGHSGDRGGALSPRGMDVLPGPAAAGQHGLDSRARPARLRLQGLQRGHDPLHPGPRIADASDLAASVDGLHELVQVGRRSRSGVRRFRAAVRVPVLPPLDRFSRHPRSLHAGERHRLLRELPPRRPTRREPTRSTIR